MWGGCGVIASDFFGELEGGELERGLAARKEPFLNRYALPLAIPSPAAAENEVGCSPSSIMLESLPSITAALLP